MAIQLEKTTAVQAAEAIIRGSASEFTVEALLEFQIARTAPGALIVDVVPKEITLLRLLSSDLRAEADQVEKRAKTLKRVVSIGDINNQPFVKEVLDLSVGLSSEKLREDAGRMDQRAERLAL